jgi:hypothetical protein
MQMKQRRRRHLRHCPAQMLFAFVKNVLASFDAVTTSLLFASGNADAPETSRFRIPEPGPGAVRDESRLGTVRSEWRK